MALDWSTLRQVNTLSLPDRLSIELERLIIDGELAVGDKLPTERELAEVLGVSRVSIRQALKELESRGLIDRKPGRGTIVLSPIGAARESGALIVAALATARPEMVNIIELRSIVEPAAAALAARRASDRDIAQLRALIDEMSGNVSHSRYAELDREFHQAIARYTHNPLLAVLAEQIGTLIEPSRHTSLQSMARRRTSTVEHRLIVDAIQAKRADEAEREALSHLQSVSAAILSAHEGREQDSPSFKDSENREKD